MLGGVCWGQVDCVAGIAATRNADSVVETSKIVHSAWSNGLYLAELRRGRIRA